MAELENHLHPKPRHIHWIWLATSLIFAGGAWLLISTLTEYRLVTHLAEHQAGLLAQKAARVVPPPGRQEVEEQKKWAQLKMERDFPWEKVFRGVENVATPEIELLEFHPDKLNRRIELRGEAKDLKGLLVYLEALNKQQGWSNVYLVHQQTVQRGALETVAFEVKATLLE